jgi:hypothetical protein
MKPKFHNTTQAMTPSGMTTSEKTVPRATFSLGASMAFA